MIGRQWCQKVTRQSCHAVWSLKSAISLPTSLRISQLSRKHHNIPMMCLSSCHATSHLLDKETALVPCDPNMVLHQIAAVTNSRRRQANSTLPLRPKHVESLKKSWISAWGFIKFSETVTLSKKKVGERLPVMWHDYYRNMMWKNE